MFIHSILIKKGYSMCKDFKCIKKKDGCSGCGGANNPCKLGCIACSYLKVTCEGNDKTSK